MVFVKSNLTIHFYQTLLFLVNLSTWRGDNPVKSPISGGFAQCEVKKDGIEIVKFPHLDNYVSSILPEPSRKTTHPGPILDPEGYGIYVTESQIM